MNTADIKSGESYWTCVRAMESLEYGEPPRKPHLAQAMWKNDVLRLTPIHDGELIVRRYGIAEPDEVFATEAEARSYYNVKASAHAVRVVKEVCEILDDIPDCMVLAQAIRMLLAGSRMERHR